MITLSVDIVLLLMGSVGPHNRNMGAIDTADNAREVFLLHETVKQTKFKFLFNMFCHFKKCCQKIIRKIFARLKALPYVGLGLPF